MGKKRKHVVVTLSCPKCGDSFDFLFDDTAFVRNAVATRAQSTSLCLECRKKNQHSYYHYVELMNAT